jgi:hypothetical protein
MTKNSRLVLMRCTDGCKAILLSPLCGTVSGRQFAGWPAGFVPALRRLDCVACDDRISAAERWHICGPRCLPGSAFRRCCCALRRPGSSASSSRGNASRRVEQSGRAASGDEPRANVERSASGSRPAAGRYTRRTPAGRPAASPASLARRFAGGQFRRGARASAGRPRARSRAAGASGSSCSGAARVARAVTVARAVIINAVIAVECRQRISAGRFARRGTTVADAWPPAAHRDDQRDRHVVADRSGRRPRTAAICSLCQRFRRGATSAGPADRAAHARRQLCPAA